MFKPRPKSACEFQQDKDSLGTNAFGAGDDNDSKFKNINDGYNVNNALNGSSQSMHIPKPGVKRARRKSTPDASFTFSEQIPAARRQSLRLANKNPEFSTKKLPKDEGIANDKDSEFKNINDGVNAITEYSQSMHSSEPVSKRTRRKSTRDASFSFLEQMATETGQSLRLANKKPKFSTKELPKDEGTASEFKNINDGNNVKNAINKYSQSMHSSKPVSKCTRRKSTRDASFLFLEQIRTEKRQSLRLANKNPEFSTKELPKDEGTVNDQDSEFKNINDGNNVNNAINEYSQSMHIPKPDVKRTRRKSTRDASSSFLEQIPTESGQSLRSANKNPEFSTKELPKDEDAADNKDSEFQNIHDGIKTTNKYFQSMHIPEPVAKRTRRKSTRDASFSRLQQIPTERGQSLRLANKDPEFSSKELPKDEGTIRKFRCESPLDEENKNAKRVRHAPLSIDGPLCSQKFTQADFDTRSSSQKIYSYDGSMCHQCQQKTFDTKIYCRSPGCNETRGLFCGPCLKNIYGEKVEAALQNVIWLCPVCRGICNCFLCCVRRGKTPTGIRVPQAFSEGFKSVRDSLNKKEVLDYLGLTNTKNNGDDIKVVIIKIPRQRVADLDLSSLIFENLARELAEVDVVCYGMHVFRIKLEHENDNELKRETNETVNEALTEISKDIGRKFLEKNKGKQLVILLDRCDAVLQKITPVVQRKRKQLKCKCFTN